MGLYQTCTTRDKKPHWLWSQKTIRVHRNCFLACSITDNIEVLYISDGCCTELNIYYFILYVFLVINDSIFKVMMLIERGIL